MPLSQLPSHLSAQVQNCLSVLGSSVWLSRFGNWQESCSNLNLILCVIIFIFNQFENWKSAQFSVDCPSCVSLSISLRHLTTWPWSRPHRQGGESRWAATAFLEHKSSQDCPENIEASNINKNLVLSQKNWLPGQRFARMNMTKVT